MPPRLGETGVPRSDPAVLLGWSWSRARCSFSARGRRVDRLPWRFCAQRRQPRRRQVCARRDALSSWREVRRPLPHRPGPSRSSTPDAFAPQARLDPPRGWRAGLAWAPALGSHCGLRGRLRHRRAARSEPIAHALQVPRPTPPRPARACRLLRLSPAVARPLSLGRPPARPQARIRASWALRRGASRVWVEERSSAAGAGAPPAFGHRRFVRPPPRPRLPLALCAAAGRVDRG